MKKRNSFVVLVLGVLIVVIIALSIINDYRFNEERRIMGRETDAMDSLMLKQIDSVIVLLNNITVELDSIQGTEKENNVIETQNIDTIKSLLSEIKMTSQNILSPKK